MALLDKAKAACRITSTAYDDELEDLISAAKLDLGIGGVTHDDLNTGADEAEDDDDEDEETEIDPLIQRAIITYCRAHLGSPDDYERLAESYLLQKGQLTMATGYTDWDVSDD